MALRRCTRLDTVLRANAMSTVDLLRVHVLGREVSVLRSLGSMLAAGAVGAVAVAVFGADVEYHKRQNVNELVHLLRSSGLLLSYEGKSGSDVESVLLEGVRPEGTTTLLGVSLTSFGIPQGEPV
eukprot:gnl/TRDRNA2_/TRDRNA2_166017_c1_seq1.p1 gnl/TRDRNA2_/TRDRNA2_166017_c1~~gnl/TRDRNA2_/TRDRNA2_166017_c1_seq1.p1  ORF type:complete len:125 (+),score=14.47 gnl/TRDRNA2_/TRDRNA2_166017_c1_seq1:148-522(+)